jgi:hypothetical protein
MLTNPSPCPKPTLLLGYNVMGLDFVDICRDVEMPPDERLDERCLEVWQKLVEILVGVLGVEADRVTFRARLVQDLGMN